MRAWVVACWAVFVVLAACGGSRGDGGEDSGPMGSDGGPSGIPVLGNGAHSVDAVEVTIIATADDALNGPRDLAFDPGRPGTLWVVDGNENAITILTDVGTAAQDWRKPSGPGSEHFLSLPSAIAFGAPGTFATAHDQDSMTQPMTPTDFMGPTLWTSELTEYDGGHHGHLDMLHNSPNAVGIAWERDNVYWVFDGAHGSLTRYDFQADHGYGGEDHSDGIVARHVNGQLGYLSGVSSHVAYDAATGLVYAADTANARIVVLDPTTGTRGAPISPNYDGTDMYEVDGSTLTVFADASDGLEHPSGMHLREGVLFVTDHATSKVYAFALDGTVLDWVDLSPQVAPGSIMGIDADPEGRLYIADAPGHRVLRVSARTP